MEEKITTLKNHVREAAANPAFIHHTWFTQWHLEIVERIALELYARYPDVDRDLLVVMAWLHDYGKILDFDHQYKTTLTEGKKTLLNIGFDLSFVDKAIAYIEILDKKLELDLHEAPLEVQIISSADGCSHLVGPFMYLWWHENHTKSFEELMTDNRRKADKDWNRKIILPEARTAFEARYRLLSEQFGSLPKTFIS